MILPASTKGFLNIGLKRLGSRLNPYWLCGALVCTVGRLCRVDQTCGLKSVTYRSGWWSYTNITPADAIEIADPLGRGARARVARHGDRRRPGHPVVPGAGPAGRGAGAGAGAEELEVAWRDVRLNYPAANPRFNADNLMREINLVTDLSWVDRLIYRFLLIPITKKLTTYDTYG